MSDAIHLVCPHCDSINRVPTSRPLLEANCGKCHDKLFEGRPLELTEQTFDRHATRSGIPLVVDFWAPWCGPCKMMAPAFAQAAKRVEPQARLAKVNTEMDQRLAMRYGIRSIPTMIVFKQGRELARTSGAMDANGIERWVKGAI
ncbi:MULTISPECIES: thioredoxin TrxC [Thiorhodovibrio]|uniref:thioredoxin TrxC n=1 Tax=Thiorhodovibrio TaxID=61593 RepID=UPI0019121032|nr:MULTISPECIES: thioredoxin TrxC [Thiorhodovibrio]MBK5968055.1 thiol reductase thioredoxin [Thiorhodovibrio winogradskyi]WPL11872.1 Thioredoxin-2 [Thiorhodovibrio litoralis]